MKNVPILLLFVFFSYTGFAQKAEVYSKNGAAIGGYDPVAYFKLAKAVKGHADLSTEWNKATWHFSSKENKEDFLDKPEKYIPQYGGYCAYGTSEGHKAPTDPEAWTIVEGKLYFNYNLHVKEMWIKEATTRIEQADIHWPLIKDKE